MDRKINNGVSESGTFNTLTQYNAKGHKDLKNTVTQTVKEMFHLILRTYFKVKKKKKSQTMKQHKSERAVIVTDCI